MSRPTNQHALSRFAFGLRIAVLAAVSVLSACTMPPENRHLTTKQFPDVPVPAGLTLDERSGKSFSMEEGSFRFGEFVYTGDATVERVQQFVQSRLPVQGWRLVEDDSDQADLQKLRYEKPGDHGRKDVLEVEIEGTTKLRRLTYVVRRR